MSIICYDCKALTFKGDSKGLCCSSRKVSLSPITDLPEPVKLLFNGTHAQSKAFLKCIRSYNSLYFRGNIYTCIQSSRSCISFSSSLLPEIDKPLQFLQIYFTFDYNEQANARLSNCQNLNKNLL